MILVELVVVVALIWWALMRPSRRRHASDTGETLRLGLNEPDFDRDAEAENGSIQRSAPGVTLMRGGLVLVSLGLFGLFVYADWVSHGFGENRPVAEALILLALLGAGGLVWGLFKFVVSRAHNSLDRNAS